MKTRIASLISLGVLLFALPAGAVAAVDSPVLEQFTVPPYPSIARLAGTEGTVGLDVSLDPKCNITDIRIGKGEPRLVGVVERSFHGDYTHLQFRPCAMSQPVVVHISYIFTLQGKPTNGWSTTTVRLTSDHGGSFNFNISTTPADLGALGLQRTNRRTEAGGNRNSNASSRRPNDGLEIMESKAREEGTGGPAQTIFTSPNYYARDMHIQGEVRIGADLDPNCRVSSAKILAGHLLLSDEVLQAVREWQFPGCSSEKRSLDIVFHFVLTEPDSPSPYDNWAPTDFEMIGPYEFKIRTVSPDSVIYN
ncbi:MAG: energy transducer TonB [Terracidiphilus sp.]